MHVVFWSRLANWSWRFHNKSIENLIRPQGHVWCICNYEVTDATQPVFELVRHFMPVLVTSKFDKNLIENEQASLKTPFSHFKSTAHFFRCPRAPNSVGSGWTLNFLPASLKKIWQKAEKRWRHGFPHYKSNGAFCSHGTRGLIWSAPKPYAAVPPPQYCST